LLSFRPKLGTRNPAYRIAELRHVADIAAVFTVCLCTANSGQGNAANPGGIIRLPSRTRLHDVVALLLSRLDAALLSRPVQPAQRAANRPGIDPHAGLSRQLVTAFNQR
jgi:hypothetical protein